MISTIMGIALHAIGAAASSSSIIPGKFIKNWQWDIYWVGFSLVSLLFLPIIGAALTIPEFWTIISQADNKVVFYTLAFGFAYGFGGYGFGLACRLLGFSMSYAISIGFSATVGTLIPPLIAGGEARENLLYTSYGAYIFSALGIAIVGMFLIGKAGYGREKSVNNEEQKNNNLVKGLIVALISGFLSACYGFALHAGNPLADKAVELGASQLLKINVVFILANGGALISNLLICFYLIVKEKNISQFFDSTNPGLRRNYTLAILGGAAWYFQFFFYGIAEQFMGTFSMASWALHMIMLIMFAQLWGIYFKEWKDTGSQVKRNLNFGLIILTFSVLLVAYGNYVTSGT